MKQQANLGGISDIIINRGFRGSKNLKRAGEVIEWTPDMQLELVKCAIDPIYFCETYMQVVHVDRGLVPFKLYDYQKEMIIAMWKKRNVIITTARQIGKSTVTCGFILWYILFNSNKTVALLANKGETAQEIMSKITLAYEHLPKWIQQGVVEFNKRSMELENNSRVIASATSGSAIRGYSINLLFIDEAAFIDNWEEFFTSVAPTISSGKTTKIVLVSTPNGLNHYYALWQNAINKKNNYKWIRVTWKQVPGRDEEWKQKTLADLNFDMDKFAQENEAEFMGSSGTLINGQALKALVSMVPILSRDSFKVYYTPEPDHKYVIVCDVSKGKGLDHSAFSVFDITSMPYQQVATFYDNLTPPVEYAEVIHMAAMMYNEAVVMVEINNIGGEVSTYLVETLEYDGMLFTENGGSKGKVISTRSGKAVDRGINTTKNVKAKGCSMLKLLVEQQQLVINDHNTIYEISRFSKKGTSYEAEQGCNDDLVMTLVLFAWMTNDQFFKQMTDINTLNELRNIRTEQMENEFAALGFVITSGGDEFRPTKAASVDYRKLTSNDIFNQQMTNTFNDGDMQRQWDALFG